MQDWTGSEVATEKLRLEREAATTLGFMLFEYSRLEMDLGLLLVWANEGKQLDSITAKFNSENMNGKLEALKNAVQAKYSGESKAAADYADWMRDAHEIRTTRNQLFHGRWGVNATRQTVSCVVGLPTSPNQRAIEYSLEELSDALESMRLLRKRLGMLRQSWPA